MTGKLEIISNHHRRSLLYWADLSNAEREEFDWMDDETAHTADFFRYKGWVYYTGDFMRINGHDDAEFSKWDGYSSDTFFSGVLVKWPVEEWGDIDTESIIVGWYLS